MPEIRVSNMKIQISEKHKNSVENSKGNYAYCHALPSEWDEKKLKDYFDPVGDLIIKVSIIKSRMGLYTGRALLEFRDKKTCDAAIKRYNENLINSKDVVQQIVMKPFHLHTNYRKTQLDKSKSFLFLNNLDFATTSEEIYNLVSDFGELEYIDMPMRRDGNLNKGHAFIKFKNVDDAEKLIRYLEMNKFNGRQIRVQREKFEF